MKDLFGYSAFTISAAWLVLCLILIVVLAVFVLTIVWA